jgi:hypothetical protein
MGFSSMMPILFRMDKGDAQALGLKTGWPMMGCKNEGARFAGRPVGCENQKLIWAPSLNSRPPRTFDGFSQFGPYRLLMKRTVLALNRL